MTDPDFVKGNVGGVYDDRECSCPREFYQRGEINTSLFFEDCVRSIDFVLAYRINAHEPTELENTEKRRVFEANLISQGLEVEASQKDQIWFVKVSLQCLINLYSVFIYIDFRSTLLWRSCDGMRKFLSCACP